jgi:hypothetical protein
LNRSRVRFFSILFLSFPPSSPSWLVIVRLWCTCPLKSAAHLGRLVRRPSAQQRSAGPIRKSDSRKFVFLYALSQKYLNVLVDKVSYSTPWLVRDSSLQRTMGGGLERRRRRVRASAAGPPMGSRSPLHAHAHHARGAAWKARSSSLSQPVRAAPASAPGSPQSLDAAAAADAAAPALDSPLSLRRPKPLRRRWKRRRPAPSTFRRDGHQNLVALLTDHSQHEKWIFCSVDAARLVVVRVRSAVAA